VISSALRIQRGLFLLTYSNSVETSLIFFLFFFFSSSFSSLISPSSSFFSFSSSSSSETSFSVVFSTYNSIGNPMNSECFLIKSFRRRSSRNSRLSYLSYKTILDPLQSLSGFSSSSTTVKVPPAVDSHLY